MKTELDKRTKAGKEIVNIVKKMDIKKMKKSAYDLDIHFALTTLRIKDIEMFFTFCKN